MRRHFLAVPALLLGLVLAGCGDEPGQQATEEPGASGSTGSTSSPTEETTAPDGPACEEVWSEGQTLPRSYRGCLEGSTWVAADSRRCESGQVLVAYADRYYGAKGARVNDMGEGLQEDQQYQQALRSCG